MTPMLAEIHRAACLILQQVDFATDCGCRPVVLVGTVEVVTEAVQAITDIVQQIKDAAGTDADGREPQRSGADRSGPASHG